MPLVYLITLILSMLSLNISAQILQISGNLFNQVSTIISNAPGNTGNNYIEPNVSELSTWSTTINNLVTGNYTTAANTANTLAYDLIQFSDTSFNPNRTYYILQSNGSNLWGTYIYYPNFCRPLVIQSPHPKADLNTGKEAAHVFRSTEAQFFCLSGTHRCNHSRFSICDGVTSACSSSSTNFRISDLAHNTNSIFQKTTEVLFNTFNNTHFIQLHGFTKQSTDPYVILSNGTQVTPTPDYLSIFSTELFNQDSTLTFKIAHTDLTWTRLRGFTNTQGRLINGSQNPCNNGAINSFGRFFHVEQEKTKLRDDITGWDKVANALNATFACTYLSTNDTPSIYPLHAYPNPVTDRITIKGSKTATDQIRLFSVLGQNFVSTITIVQEQSNEIILDLSSIPPGIYILSLNNQTKVIHKQ